MVAFHTVKKAVTLSPTVRALPSGVPVAPLVNLAVRAPNDGHGHGHAASGHRSDVPPRWTGGVTLTSAGLVSKSYLSKHTRSLRTSSVILNHGPASPPAFLNHHRLLHTSAPAKDAPHVPDLSAYRSKSDSTNRALSYFMVGTMGVLSASVAKSSVTGFLETMAASADVLALAKAEVELAKIPEGKNLVIKWRGKPVFIRHRTPEEIEEASSIDVKSLRDPQADSERVKKPEWLVMLGVCTHLGCVPIGEAGDYGGWFVILTSLALVVFAMVQIVHLINRFCPCHGSHYDICAFNVSVSVGQNLNAVIAGRVRKGPAPVLDHLLPCAQWLTCPFLAQPRSSNIRIQRSRRQIGHRLKESGYILPRQMPSAVALIDAVAFQVCRCGLMSL
jgi:ubiquinol-cytochrome c reductase iron-sulfur subunit